MRHLSPENLRAYIEDRLTEQERHEIELHLLDCDFCSEALEGLEQLGTVEYQKSIASLEAKMASYQKKKSSNLWIVWASAAALAVLIGSSIVWTVQKMKDVTDIALTDSSKPENTEEKIEKKEESEPIPHTEEQTQQMDKSAAINNLEEPATPEILEGEPMDEDQVFEIAEYSTPLIERDNTSDKALKIADDERVEDKGLNTNNVMMSSAQPLENDRRKKTVTGTVQDESGEPVPFATVSDEYSKVNTVTDFEGEFEIDVSDKTDSLIVRSVGYREVREKAKDQPMNITMREETAMMDVIEMKVEHQKTFPATVAQPVIGGKAYKQYLDSALIYPEEAKKAGIEGKVILRIEVYSNGMLGEISIEKGLGYGCDEEAIRLVREGPKWKAATQEGAAMTTTISQKIKFKL